MEAIWVYLILTTASAVDAGSWFATRLPPLRWSPPVKADLPLLDIESAYMEMPLDHFDASDNRTYQMRYLINDGCANSSNDTILLMIGGEWTINTGFLVSGSMYEIAKQNGARMMYTEHRYYGGSVPVDDLSTSNLAYLSVDQALEDLAYFIGSLKREQPARKIIIFGGSYAANVVVWFAQRYPHLVDGAVASSGPVLAQRDFQGYLQVVHDTILEEGGPECVRVLQEAVQELRREMGSAEGRSRIETAYSLCSPPDITAPFEVQYFYAVITWGFSGLVQAAGPGTVARECSLLVSDELGATPFDRLARYVVDLPPGYCQDLKYQDMIGVYLNTDARNENRAWYYQTCSEFGYYQTSPGTGSIFDGLLSVDFYEEVCRRVFSENFTSEHIEEAVSRTNMAHGGLHPRVTRLVSVHGLQDPWHALGVRHDLAPSAPTYLVPGASHCFDMYGSDGGDTPEIAAVKMKVADIVAGWMKQ